MGEYGITSLDASLVGLVLLLSQGLKKRVRKRWVPMVPVALAFLLTIPAVLVAHDGWPGLSVFLSQVFLEGLKTATLAMATYKVHRTTIRGR